MFSKRNFPVSGFCLDCKPDYACDTCAFAWFVATWERRKKRSLPQVFWDAAKRSNPRKVAQFVINTGWSEDVDVRWRKRYYSAFRGHILRERMKTGAAQD
jgi:hypothetical protein